MVTLPKELEMVRESAMRAIAPIRGADDSTKAEPNFLFSAKRTNAGRDLPAYYLLYFLLVDLLGFKNLGKFEKLAWSVPVDYNGEAFLIEHRKFGVGVFAQDPATQETQARDIVTLLKKGVRIAEPFFDWLASQAVHNSKLNVVNRTDDLFERFDFFLSEYRRTAKEAFDRAERHRAQKHHVENWNLSEESFPCFTLEDRVHWLALATIDAFFSWTEHIFIHLAILLGNVATGTEVANLADSNWESKFKRALDITEPATKVLFDNLIEIRRQHRNFIAHGAFGKRGEAFSFHSGAGAVPVLLPHHRGKHRFALATNKPFEDPAALRVIQDFLEHLWTGARAPARLYLQRSTLPLILTMAMDGTYQRAMQSVEDMQELVDHLTGEWERAANMDW